MDAISLDRPIDADSGRRPDSTTAVHRDATDRALLANAADLVRLFEACWATIMAAAGIAGTTTDGIDFDYAAHAERMFNDLATSSSS